MELTVHLIIHTGGILLERNAHHALTQVFPKPHTIAEEKSMEAPIWVQIDQQTDPR